jgi:hypothetical protein
MFTCPMVGPGPGGLSSWFTTCSRRSVHNFLEVRDEVVVYLDRRAVDRCFCMNLGILGI